MHRHTHQQKHLYNNRSYKNQQNQQKQTKALWNGSCLLCECVFVTNYSGMSPQKKKKNQILIIQYSHHRTVKATERWVSGLFKLCVSVWSADIENTKKWEILCLAKVLLFVDSRVSAVRICWRTIRGFTSRDMNRNIKIQYAALDFALGSWREQITELTSQVSVL